MKKTYFQVCEGNGGIHPFIHFETNEDAIKYLEGMCSCCYFIREVDEYIPTKIDNCFSDNKISKTDFLKNLDASIS